MSTFKGLLRDQLLDFIAVDYFEKITHKCVIFLLSHLHADHYRGLFDSTFLSTLNESEDKYIYCSPVTKNFLIHRVPYINKDKIIAMNINKSFIIQQKKLDTDVVVTCLPAGHCPGSVMFLIEYNDHRVLYTGDIRLNVNDLKKIKGRLSNADGSVIPIDELYLDTTFAIPSQFDDFPAREDSEKVIIDNIERWLSSSKKCGRNLKIVLNIPANFGSEYLYFGLYKRFKKPIAIHNFKFYSQVEEMADYVIPFEEFEDEPDVWLIHACRSKKCSIYLKNYYLKFIKPCAYSFIHKTSEKFPLHKLHKVPYFQSYNELKVLYSSHCSLNELRSFVKYLQPTDIIANVKQDCISVEDMLSLIRCEDPSIKYRFKIPVNNDRVPKEISRTLKPSVTKRSREENELIEEEIRKKLKLKF